ncbi:FimV/HubP family polar landmark protein [Halopseudomonas sp.]|uniref:type IV pilus assembly protein FimV n=1 Tax=Halopseudomonas sp. TaxID=2901191 RepID=UPI00311ED870
MAAKRQIVLGAASLAALYAGVAGALGLGEIQLESALNQPLNAVIELQGAEGLGPDDVVVRLAQTTDFDNAGIDKPYFLDSLRFTPVLQNRRLTILVRSTQPVREPYLNFLVELRRPNGRMLREYTVLLDPPVYTSTASAPVAAAPVVAPARPSAAPVRTAPRPQAPLPNLTPQPDAGSYTTVSGDSLWGIAERSRPAASVSIGDTMTAIHALNQQAFVDGDINRLKVGQTLVLPTAQQLGASGGQAPVRESAPSAPPGPTAPAPQPTSEQRIAETVEDSADDAVGAAATTDSTQGRLRIEEDAVSEAEAESAVLASRLNELEGRFNTLLSELDSRDRQIASLQAELEVLNAAREAEEAAAARTAVGGTLGEGEGGDAVSPTGSDDPVAGAIAADVPTATEESKSSFVWWPVLLAVLAFFVGWLVSRKRKQPDEERFVPPTRPTPMARPTAASEAASPVRVVAPAAVAGAAAVAGSESEVVDNLGGIELYITYGRFPEARDALEKAIAEEPERLELRFKQARVMGELGDSDGFAEQAEAIRALGGDMLRVDQLRARFPQLDQVAAPVDTVEDVLESGAELEDADLADSQLNLNDFTLDPDWDLIEGLNPTPARKNSKLDPIALDDEVFESSLHEFPEIEELDDLDDFESQANLSTLNDEGNKR